MSGSPTTFALNAETAIPAVGFGIYLISNDDAEGAIQSAIAAAGLPMPDANQIELHPWSQKPDLQTHMTKHKIAPVAFRSLAPLSTWRTEPGQDSAKTDDMKADGEAFKGMAQKYGVSEAQLLLRWGVQNGYAVLPKSLNPDRMAQNLDLFSFTIDDADMAQMATMDRGDGVAWASGDPSK
jgi:2,5-diketo-D-gluconate reductase A